MSLYTMKLSDSVDTMEFNLLEVPIQDKDIEGAVDNVVLSGDIYTDFLWLKKRFTHKWSILCKDDYERLRGFYTRQFSNAEVPIYQLLDAPSPIEDSAGSGEYIQITTTDSTAKLASVEMLGKAEQTTYSGKNLCSRGYYESTATARFEVNKTTLQQTFTISYISDVTAGNAAIYLFTDGTNRGSVGVTIQQTAGTRRSATITLDATNWGYVQNATAVRFTAYLGNAGHTTDATINQAMVENGSSMTAYEPYVGGTPAPNPSFPQPISVVTGENVVKITGKNLLPINDGTATTRGITATVADGVLTLNGTSTGSGIFKLTNGIEGAESLAPSASWLTEKFPITNLNGTNIAIDYQSGTSPQTSSAFRLYGSTSTYINQWYPLTSDQATGWTSDTQAPSCLCFFFGNGITFSNYKITLQIERGNSASQFEPYQGQEFEVNLGKNLFSISQDTIITNAYLNNNTALTFDSLNSVKFVATGAQGAQYLDRIISGLDSTKSYTFSFKAIKNVKGSTGLPYIQIVAYGSNDGSTWTGLGFSRNDNPTEGETYSFAKTLTGYSQYRFMIFNNADTPVEIGETTTYFDMQLEEGAQTAYAPYFPPIELAKIGTYQDRIYKTDSKWYIEKQVGKVVFDGTEDGWGWADTARYTIATANIGAREAISDHFTYVNYTGHTTTASPSFDISSNLASIGFHDKDITSLNNFKTWLGTHNTTVYYALATPTTTEITNEALIAQLDALGASSLYLGVNNIGTETQNAMPTLALTYFPYYPHEIISPKAVRMELTDGGIINACECRENVQLTLRETIQ